MTFLPINYKTSVRKEYLQYQLYDSIQGLCSYIRSVITIRSLLIGAGVGDSNKSATSAALAWALKDGVGNIGTLVLAYTSSQSFEVYTKEWRFLADVLNNIALTLDLGSNFLILFSKNEYHYALLLAISSLFKCFCGLIAGATKARISAHFAIDDSLADITAKESTQETFVSLLGLVLGSFVTKVFGDSDFDNVFVFFLLTAIHFWANYKLTKTLVFDTLNPQRCWLITKYMIENKSVLVPSPIEISNEETLLRPLYLKYYGPQIGVSINEILNTLDFIKGVQPTTSTVTKKVLEISWKNLVDCFRDEHYIIGIDKNDRIVICLSETANNDNSIILRAYMMGCFLHHTWNNSDVKQEKDRKSRIANLYSRLINIDSKRCLNWYNHMIAVSQKGGLVKASTELFSGWDISKNKTKLEDFSLRYKFMRSVASFSEDDSNEKETANDLSASKTSEKRTVSWSDAVPSTPVPNIESLDRFAPSSVDSNGDVKDETSLADVLLTYTGTNLVLDLLSPSSKGVNTGRENRDIKENLDKYNLEDKFSKGEESLH